MTDRASTLGESVTTALVAVGVLVLSCGVLVGLVAPAASVPVTFGAGSGDPIPVDQTNPAAIEDNRDLTAFEEQLIGQFADAGSDRNLSQSQVEQLRGELGNETVQSLTNQTDPINGSSNETSRTQNETSNQTVQSQRLQRVQRLEKKFARVLDAYWTTYDAYQQAKRGLEVGSALERREYPEPGETDPADLRATEPSELRALAKELATRERRVTNSKIELIDAYRALGNVSNESYDDDIEAARAQATNVTATQFRVERGTIVSTSFILRTSPTTVSFGNRTTVRGWLVAANGTGLRNATISVELGNVTVYTKTGKLGAFQVSISPTVLPDASTDLSIEYDAPVGAVYMDATRTVDLTVRQKRPRVSVDLNQSEVRFNNAITITGRAVVNGTAVPAAPYEVRIGNRTVAKNRTGIDGRFTSTIRIPSTVKPGNRTVQVVVGVGSPSLTATTVNRPIRVTQIPSTLSITATNLDGRTLRVNGTLRSDEGPVPNRTVRIAIEGTTVTTVRTGPVGTFDTTIVAPESLFDAGLLGDERTLNVSASFGAGSNVAGGNVAGSTATATARASVPGQPAVLVAVPVAVVLVAGLGLYRRWSGGDGTAASGEPREAPEPDQAPGESVPPPETTIEIAREFLADSSVEFAARATYSSLRDGLERQLEPDREGASRTHWEFYRACQDAGINEETLTTLRTVTELYERATFAPASVSEQQVRTTLEEVESVVTDTASVDRGGD